MTDDLQLLRQYADEGSAAAFTELVRRNVDLVYAAALRRVGDPGRAQDVAQSVFIDLARKAKALRRHPALVSWLHASTRFAALKALRAERRRITREREAHAMDELHSEPNLPWDRLQPVLDDALNELGEADRAIVLLRYFRGLAFADVAVALRVSEGAARMRLDRALDRLRSRLADRGISSTAAALGVALAEQPLVAAPAGLAGGIAHAALGSGAAGVGVAGTLLAMTKSLQIAAAAAVLAVAAVPLAVAWHTHRGLAADLARAQAENVPAPAGAPSDADKSAAAPDAAELQRLRDRLAQLEARPAGVTDAAMKPASAWQNRGQATPADTYETRLWAASVGDLDALAKTTYFDASARAILADFFAGVDPSVRARYHSPERLLVERFLDVLDPRANLPAAFQVLGEKLDFKSDTEVRVVHTWVRLSSGAERMDGAQFVTGPGGWLIAPAKPLPDAYWRALLTEIDPATGQFRPGGAERFRHALGGTR